MYYLVDKKNGKTNENVDPKIVQFKYINLLLRKNDYETLQNIIEKHLDICILFLIFTGRHN